MTNIGTTAVVIANDDVVVTRIDACTYSTVWLSRLQVVNDVGYPFPRPLSVGQSICLTATPAGKLW